MNNKREDMQFIPTWPYGILLALALVANVFHRIGYKKGLKAGEIVLVKEDNYNNEGLKNIIVHSEIGRTYRFIRNTNGEYLPWEYYRTLPESDGSEKVERLEREVGSNALQRVEGRQ
ncbi:MAG: hypothetical protein AABX11_02335 [Nanoarchaeota archaeon]